MMAKKGHTHTTPWEEQITGSRDASDNRKQEMSTTSEEKHTVQADEQPGNMIVDTDGPFNSTEDTRAVRETQEATNIPPYVPNSQTSLKKDQNANKTQTPGLQGKGRECVPTPDDELPPFHPTTSPKHNKKLKMERDMTLPRERTRSTTRNITPQRL